MKKRIVQIIVAGAFIAAPLFMFGQPAPGNNSGGPNDPVGGDPIGGGGGTAPIGGGIVLLLSMAAGYGMKKVFDARNKFEE
ncbi:MAG: hypothetical protein AB9834_04380 [Lentimicrobium sp.]